MNQATSFVLAGKRKRGGVRVGSEAGFESARVMNCRNALVIGGAHVATIKAGASSRRDTIFSFDDNSFGAGGGAIHGARGVLRSRCATHPAIVKTPTWPSYARNRSESPRL